MSNKVWEVQKRLISVYKTSGDSDEIYDDYFKDGTKPEDFWDKEEGQAYAAWLKKNPNGRPDF